MIKTIELHKTWSVHNNKLPDLTNLDYIEQSTICLSSSIDSLLVTVNKEKYNDTIKYYLSMVDISNNKISYFVSEEDYEQSKSLIGKVLEKKVYPIKTTDNRIIQLDVYKNIKLFVANYYATTDVLLQTLVEEEWFNEEVNDLRFSDIELFNKI